MRGRAHGDELRRQVHKILNTRDTSSLSTRMWILSTAAFAIWIVYGVVLGEWPIILPNAVCFLLAGLILTLKVMSPRQRETICQSAIGGWARRDREITCRLAGVS
jgi:MtN3 and saliva related transmembrane protein